MTELVSVIKRYPALCINKWSNRTDRPCGYRSDRSYRRNGTDRPFGNRPDRSDGSNRPDRSYRRDGTDRSFGNRPDRSNGSDRSDGRNGTNWPDRSDGCYRRCRSSGITGFTGG